MVLKNNFVVEILIDNVATAEFPFEDNTIALAVKNKPYHIRLGNCQKFVVAAKLEIDGNSTGACYPILPNTSIVVRGFAVTPEKQREFVFSPPPVVSGDETHHNVCGMEDIGVVKASFYKIRQLHRARVAPSSVIEQRAVPEEHLQLQPVTTKAGKEINDGGRSGCAIILEENPIQTISIHYAEMYQLIASHIAPSTFPNVANNSNNNNLNNAESNNKNTPILARPNSLESNSNLLFFNPMWKSQRNADIVDLDIKGNISGLLNRSLPNLSLTSLQTPASPPIQQQEPLEQRNHPQYKLQTEFKESLHKVICEQERSYKQQEKQQEEETIEKLLMMKRKVNVLDDCADTRPLKQIKGEHSVMSIQNLV